MIGATLAMAHRVESNNTVVAVKESVEFFMAYLV
jgi:hypothetical protein